MSSIATFEFAAECDLMASMPEPSLLLGLGLSAADRPDTMPSCAAQMKSPQAVPEKVDQREQALKAGMGAVRRKAYRKPHKEDP